MSLKLTAVAGMIVSLLRLISVGELKPMGQSGNSMLEKHPDTAGIIKRGDSCAVSEYDEELSSGVESLSYNQMYDMIKYNRSEFVLVDVRTPQEYAQGFIPTAFLVPWNRMEGGFEDHVDFRQIMCGRKYIVVYCRSGARAARAANLLKSSIPVKIYPGSWLEWSRNNPRNVVN